jgi:triosephosphate isomerase
MKKRGLWLAGNWKMNHTRADAARFFEGLMSQWKPLLSDSTVLSLGKEGGLRQTLFVGPLLLEPLREMGLRAAFDVGAQNAHGAVAGAFTGEVSAPQLLEVGVERVLLGHSERRQFFGETDLSLRSRLDGLLAQNLRCLVCVGETRQEREAGKTAEVLRRQLEALIADRKLGSFFDGERVAIAYEPVWAIGTGLTATPAQAEEAHRVIRDALRKDLGEAASERTQILYGGSVSPANVRELLAQPSIDGALVGGASLKPESWLQLLEGAGSVLQSIS